MPDLKCNAHSCIQGIKSIIWRSPAGLVLDEAGSVAMDLELDLQVLIVDGLWCWSVKGLDLAQ